MRIPAVALALLVGAALPSIADAHTHCTGTVGRIWAGDGGHIFIHYTMSDGTAGAAVMTPTNPNREAVLSLAAIALTTSRRVTVRYTPDGASCAGPHFDVEGMYLEP